MEKVGITALVAPKIKQEFQEILLQKHGHVSGKISPTIEKLIERWIKEEKKNYGTNGGSKELGS